MCLTIVTLCFGSWALATFPPSGCVATCSKWELYIHENLCIKTILLSELGRTLR